MTPSDLKYQHEQHQPDSLFFERDTMKFFGDTMSNYTVPRKLVQVKDHHDIVHECWELRRKRPVNGGLQTSAYFDATTFERIRGEEL